MKQSSETAMDVNSFRNVRPVVWAMYHNKMSSSEQWCSCLTKNKIMVNVI